jgi:hypothetical protein
MPIVTVLQVLKRATDFEKLLADYYANVATKTVREGVRLLSDYMSRHQNRIAEALDKLPPDRLHHVQNCPLRYEPQAADCRCLTRMGLPPDAKAAQVLDVAIVFDECLIQLYRQVVQQPVEEEVKELFESLIRMEETDEVRLKKIKAMDYF